MCFVKMPKKKKKLTTEEKKKQEKESAKALGKVYTQIIKNSIGRYIR